MDRRRLALVALAAFAVVTAIAIGVSGTRPASAQGLASFAVQVVGYCFAVVGGLALLRSGDRAGADRRLGSAVLAAVAGRLVATTVTAAGRRRRP